MFWRLQSAKLLEDHEPEARIRGWMTLTKILVPTCRYCLNHEIWSVDF